MYSFPTILANPRRYREVYLGKKMARENLEGKNNAGFQVNFPRFSFLLILLSARFHICVDRIQFILLSNVTLTVFFK